MRKTEKALRRKIRRLARENEYLRYRLASLGEGIKDGEKENVCFSERAGFAAAVGKGNYLSYLIHRLRVSLLFRLFDRTRFAVRGFFLATKLWNFFLWLAVLLGFGTQFLLAAGAVLVLLPALILALFVLVLVGIVTHRKRKREMMLLLKQCHFKRKYAVFVRKNDEKRPFFQNMLRQLSEEGTVFLIDRSLNAGGIYHVRCVSENIYAVHISFWFSLKKLIEEKLVLIY